MRYRSTLRSSILNALLASSALTGLVFIAVTLVAINLVERQMMFMDLRSDLERVRSELASDPDESPSLERDMLFFSHAHSATEPLPGPFADFSPGLHKVAYQDTRFHMLVDRVNGDRVALLQKRHSILDRQWLLFASLIGGYLISLLTAWWLGRLLAKKVIAPVKRLAVQVADREKGDFSEGPLAATHADDEIGHLARAFDSLMKTLHETLERERLFTADVSHELRTPLMAMATTCELLMSQEGLAARQYRSLERLQENCARMQDMVQACLSLAREAPKEVEDGQQAGSSELARSVTDQLRPLAEKHGIRLEFQGDPGAPSVNNADMLAISVGNLVRNAIQHSSSDQIRVEVEGDRVSVIDYGRGLSGGHHDLLAPFSRGDDVTGAGVGLGLSLVQRVCERQRWRLEIDSPSPRGARFSITLSEPEQS